MSHSEQLQSAFVLHARPWRETSLIIDFFTENYGKIALIAKGVRSKKSLKRSILQPLSPLLICWKGRGELPTLTQVDIASPAIKLSSDALYSSFYINELLVRLLHRYDAHPELFSQYNQTLHQLANIDSLEINLREFELQLLSSIGYGLTLDYDFDDQPIDETEYYLLNHDGMFQKAMANSVTEDSKNIRLFLGRQLISIMTKNWHHTEVLKDAKRLLRLSIQPLLGDRPLQSRRLFSGH